MRLVLLPLVLAGLVGCAGSQAQRIPADPPASVAPARPAVEPIASPAQLTTTRKAPILDEQTVIAQSRAWWDALDRRDSQAVVAALGPTFVLFEDGRFHDRDVLEQSLHSRKAKAMPARTRTWKSQRVFSAEGTSVFVGESSEAAPDKPPIEGWSTLVWTHDGATWTIAYAHWDRGGLAAEKERWNEYFAQGIGFSKEPNKALVEAVKGVKRPGRALDIAMGQGRNAVFLATQGWNTTGVDISDEGIRQAKAAAAANKVKLDALLVDVDNWDLGTNKWDLITLIYAGADPKLIARIKSALNKGGMIVVEYFHADSPAAKSGAGGFRTGELAAAFADGFEILRDEVIEDNADWAGGRKMQLVRFVARRK